jgi:hypothetical protein
MFIKSRVKSIVEVIPASTTPNTSQIAANLILHGGTIPIRSLRMPMLHK